MLAQTVNEKGISQKRRLAWLKTRQTQSYRLPQTLFIIQQT